MSSKDSDQEMPAEPSPPPPPTKEKKARKKMTDAQKKSLKDFMDKSKMSSSEKKSMRMKIMQRMLKDDKMTPKKAMNQIKKAK
jgi:hypothetical protein